MSRNNSTHNPMPIIEEAIGALKLMQVHFDHPTTISKEVASATVNEAIERLQLIQPSALRLAEAYASVILNGTVVEQQVIASTPQALVELLRVRSTAQAIAEVPAA